MNVVNSIQHSINETLQAFVLHFVHFVESGFKVGKNISSLPFTWNTPIEFTPLQWTLFKVLSLLILLTSLLIGYSWKVYGKVITDKFVRPSKC